MIKKMREEFGFVLLSPATPKSPTTDHCTVIDGVFGKLPDYDIQVHIYEAYHSDHKPIVCRLSKKVISTGLTQTVQSISIN